MTNDSSTTAFGNSTSTSDPIIVLVAAVSSVASFVLIFCGIMVLIVLLRIRSRSCKHVSTEESDTQPSPYNENISSPYYENIDTIRPRVIEATYQDQGFELVDNVCYGPLPLPATIYSH